MLAPFQSPAPPTVPAGVQVEATLETAVRTDTATVGDPVMAVLERPLASRGVVVAPEGSRLHGRVETVQAGTEGNEGRVRLVFREIEFPDGRRTSTWITNAFQATSPRRAARHLIFVVAGAVAGGFAGGDKARMTGILGGMFGGFLLSTNTGTGARDLTLRPGQRIRLQLGQDLTDGKSGSVYLIRKNVTKSAILPN